MITFKQTGDFSKTFNFLNNINKMNISDILDKFGEQGVNILSENTPVDSGLTATSWYYKIDSSKEKTKLSWYNSNIVNGVPIAIILQYGHGTKNGGYVEGRDYINPSIKPLFDDMANQVWREVTSK
jgi:hypothetical protein